MSYIKLLRSYNEIKKSVTSRKASLGCICWVEVGMGGIACKKTQRREAMECGLALSTRMVITLHWGKVTQITWGNILRLVPGKPHLILKLKGETLIATSAEAGMATEAIYGVTTSLNLSNTWAFLKWVFALSVHFTEFPSRRISRIPPVLCLPSLHFSQQWPLWQIHSLFSATYPGASPSAAKLQILDSNLSTTPAGTWGHGLCEGHSPRSPCTDRAAERQAAWGTSGYMGALGPAPRILQWPDADTVSWEHSQRTEPSRAQGSVPWCSEELRSEITGPGATHEDLTGLPRLRACVSSGFSRATRSAPGDGKPKYIGCPEHSLHLILLKWHHQVTAHATPGIAPLPVIRLFCLSPKFHPTPPSCGIPQSWDSLLTPFLFQLLRSP